MYVIRMYAKRQLYYAVLLPLLLDTRPCMLQALYIWTDVE